MGGGIAIAFVLVVVIPVAVLIGATLAAVVLGWFLKADGEENHPGSELIACND